MNRNVAITTGVLAGAIGLGFLSYFLFSKKEVVSEETDERADPVDASPQSEKLVEAIVVSKNDDKGETKKERVNQYVEADLPEEPIKIVKHQEDLDLSDKSEPFNGLTTVSTSNEKKKSSGLKIVQDAPVKEIVGDEFPLQFGSKGPRVERLQVWLLRNHGYTGEVSKAFDEKTLKLVTKHLKTEIIEEGLYNKLGMEKRVYEQAKA